MRGILATEAELAIREKRLEIERASDGGGQRDEHDHFDIKQLDRKLAPELFIDNNQAQRNWSVEFI